MATTNIVTSLYQANGSLDDATIQAHINAQNNNGYNLVFVEDKGGWYRFYWEKTV